MNSLIIKANYTNTWGSNTELNVYGNIVVCFPCLQKKLKLWTSYQITQASSINTDSYSVIRGMLMKILNQHLVASPLIHNKEYVVL